MDAVIGITGKDFVLVATDAMAGRSIMLFKDDEDKSLALNKNTLLAMSGPQGDRSHFGEYIRRNVYLKELREGIPMTTSSIAHFTRNELHEGVRKGPYQVNILLAGVDDDVPALYYMDYLASMQKVNFGVHGHASNFLLSVLDRYWVKDMTLEEAKVCLEKCQHELRSRFLINLANWKIKVVRTDSVEEITL